MLFIPLPFNKIVRYNTRKKKITKTIDLGYNHDMIVDYEYNETQDQIVVLTISGVLKIFDKSDKLTEYKNFTTPGKFL